MFLLPRILLMLIITPLINNEMIGLLKRTGFHNIARATHHSVIAHSNNNDDDDDGLPSEILIAWHKDQTKTYTVPQVSRPCPLCTKTSWPSIFENPIPDGTSPIYYCGYCNAVTN